MSDGLKRFVRLVGYFCVAVIALHGVTANAQSGGQFAISANGVPTYTYPLQVPPGIAGMEPRLALAYSGGGVNGPVGNGWSIQGLSVVTRCATTLATDGTRVGVKFQPSDKICVDGQRLIQTDANGTPLASQVDDARGLASGYREYRTEKDSFARIRAYGISNGVDTNGPQFFQVWTKSGQLYQYGTTSDSNIEVQGSGVVAVWAVSHILDTVGNFIDFSYEKQSSFWGSGPPPAGTTGGGPKPGQEWNLSEIRYTGHGAQSPANKIAFTYAARVSDGSEAYHQGAKNVSSRYLTAVRTYTNISATPVEVKFFKLAYNSSPTTQRLRLQSIAECRGSDETKCMPATQYSYGDGGDETYIPGAGFNLAGTRLFKQDNSYGVLTGDFDGDGKTDIVRWSNIPSENALYFSRPIASGSMNTPDTLNFVQAMNFNITDQNLNRSDGCFFSIVADFNGDGMADILRWASDGADLDGNLVCPSGQNSYLYLSRGDGTFKQVPLPQLGRMRNRIVPGPFLDIPPRSGGSTFFIGDFNGDGILDIMLAKIPSRPADYMGDPNDCGQVSCTSIFKGNADGTFTVIQPPSLIHTSVFVTPDSNTRYFLDLDGDQLQDLIHPSSGRRFISNGVNDFTALSAGAAQLTCTTLPLDANGDGKPDFLCPGANGANSLNIGTGGGYFFTSYQFNLVGAGYEMSGTSGVIPIDVNGDGRSDLLRWSDDNLKNTLWLSNGDGSFRMSSSFNLAGVQLKNTANQYDLVIGDFTGRGSIEILRLADNLTNAVYVKQNPAPPDLLTQVSTPLGSPTAVQYAALSQAGAPYASGRPLGQDPVVASLYPKLIVQYPGYVVTKVTADSAGGAGGPFESHYQYAGLRGTYDGRGFLGFTDMWQDSQGPNAEYLTTQSSYLQDFPYIGLPNQVKTTRGSIAAGPGGQLLSLSTSAYCDQTASVGCTSTSKVRQPYLQQSIEQGWDLGGVALPTVTTTNVFDTYGNPTQISSQTSGSVGGLAQTFTKTVNNSYLAPNVSGDNWILGRLARATTTNSVPDDVLAVSAGNNPNATATQGTTTALVVSVSPASVVASRPTAGTVTASATVAVAEGTAPFTYQWAHTTGTLVSESGGQVATFSAPLASGQSISESYTVTVTDAAGRIGTKLVAILFSIGGPGSLSVSVTPSPVTATRSGAGAISASANVGVSGGTAPYSYTWTRVTGSRIGVTGTQSATFSATLGPNESITESFNVAVTDSVGAAGNQNVNITFTSSAASPLVISVSPSSVTGSRFNPGPVSATATISASGGAAPYTYGWSRVTGSRISESGAQVGTFSATLGWGENLTETYAATVTDSVGASATQNVSITFTTPQNLTATISPSPLVVYANDPGTLSGTASVAASGGIAPYSYNWVHSIGARITESGGQTATFTANVGWGENFTEIYGVVVTDAVGNTATVNLNITMTTPSQLVNLIDPPALVVNAGDAGIASGGVNVHPSGGAGAYSYTWTRLTGSRISVSGGAIGTFTVSLGYNENLTETFRSTVTDQAGHSATADVNVTFTSPAPPPVVSIAPSSISATRAGAGAISRNATVSVTSGTPPFSYAWTRISGDLTLDVSGGQVATFSTNFSLAGEFVQATFQVVVTDALGRQANATIAVQFNSNCQGTICP